jgi:hypothetical protein
VLVAGKVEVANGGVGLIPFGEIETLHEVRVNIVKKEIKTNARIGSILSEKPMCAHRL